MKLMSKSLVVFCLFFLFFTIPSTAFAQSSSVLCVRNKFKAKKKIKLVKFVTAVNGVCPKKFTQVLDAADATNISNAIKGSDGAGSGIDADLLDGISSEGFASATALNTANTNISTVTGNLSSLTTQVSDLESATSVENIIRVGVSGGDYTSIADAVAAASGATLNSPYLIKVGPGVFSVNSSITVPSGVHIMGSGADNTIITGAVTADGLNADAAIFSISDGSQISNLTVRNTGTADNALGIYMAAINEVDVSNESSYDTVVRDVKVEVNGASADVHYGVFVSSSDVRFESVQVSVTGSTAFNVGFGIFSVASTVFMNNIVINADNNDSLDAGIRVNQSTVVIRNSDIFGYADGFNLVGGTAGISNSRIIGGTNGVNVNVTGTVTITHSQVISADDGLQANGATSVINASQVVIDAPDQLALSGGGTANCSAISDVSGNFYPTTCE